MTLPLSVSASRVSTVATAMPRRSLPDARCPAGCTTKTCFTCCMSGLGACDCTERCNTCAGTATDSSAFARGEARCQNNPATWTLLNTIIAAISVCEQTCNTDGRWRITVSIADPYARVCPNPPQ